MRIIGIELADARYGALIERLHIERYRTKVGLEVVGEQPPDAVLVDVESSPNGLQMAKIIRGLPFEGALIGFASGDRRSIGSQEEEAYFISLGGDRLLSSDTSCKLVEVILETLARRSRRCIAHQDRRFVRLGGRLTIDLECRSARLDGRSLELAPSPFAVLCYLAERPGFVRTREQILDAIKTEDVLDRTVDSHMKKIRLALGASAKDCIETVYKAGYRFVE